MPSGVVKFSAAIHEYDSDAGPPPMICGSTSSACDIPIPSTPAPATARIVEAGMSFLKRTFNFSVHSISDLNLPSMRHLARERAGGHEGRERGVTFLAPTGASIGYWLEGILDRGTNGDDLFGSQLNNTGQQVLAQMLC
ncbi:hypothetical protein GCM10027436_07550 [Actinophytocola sediminis]